LLSHAPSKEIPAAVIQVEKLRCGYPGRSVLNGVSFQIGHGEFVGLLGPNGSGKTTMLLALSGIIPVDSGRIEIMQQPLMHLKHRERACCMAVVAQDSEVRFPFSCEEVVRMGRYPHQSRWQLENANDAKIIRRALRLTDTEVLADRLITAISGGERQRVLMAKALAQDTPLLLLDEATSAMDINRKLQVFRVLETLNREEGLTVMTVLHDINLAALFCRRLLLLKDGSIVADGDIGEVLTAEVLKQVYDTEVLVQEIAGTGKRQVVFLP
jgi:iron complex transport system ATP-binding protein